MTLLPVVARELRVASRRRSIYSSRVVAAVIAVAVAGWITLTLPKMFPSSVVGAELFKVLSWFAVVYALISGAMTTADTISAEKRQGTLGLLFLTDLKGYDVLLGKLAASSLGTFYGIVGMIPVLGLPLLMAGVTAGEFARVGLAVLATLLFSLSAGMFASSVSYVERKATGAAFLLVAFAGAGIPIIATFINSTGRPGLAQAVLVASPAFACSKAFAPAYATGAARYWLTIAFAVAWSALLLSIASRAAARVWADKPQRLGQFGWRERWRRKLRGAPQVQQEFRRRLLDRNAVLWLASRDRQVRLYPWIFLFSMAAIWFWGLLIDRDFVKLEGTTILFCATHLIFKIWFGNVASYGFSTDRDRGALEMVLCTPLRLSDIFKGQWLALGRLFFWPFVALLAVEWLLISTNAVRGLSASHHDIGEWVAFAIFGAVLFLTDCAALGWLGLWQSLRSKTPHQAASVGIAIILVLPTGVMLGIVGLAALLDANISSMFCITLWLVIGLLTDLGVVVAVRTNFRYDLRYLVSEHSARRAISERGSA